MKITPILLLTLLFYTASFAQTINLSSVDSFLEIASDMRNGKVITEQQWNEFDASAGYKKFAASENQFLINTIKSSMYMVFADQYPAKKDSIMNFSKKELESSRAMMLEKLILKNYQDIDDHFEEVVQFHKEYDFETLVEKSKIRLSEFLGKPLEDSIQLIPINLFVISADGSAKPDAIYADFNLIFKLQEQQRIDFIAHEFFHDYREHFEDHNFNYANDLHYIIDMIQNEGIADQIDKTDGYEKYYTEVVDVPEMIETMTELYNQAPQDLERFQTILLKYWNNELSKDQTVDQVLEVAKFNGHALGFYMSNTIVKAGYRKEMMETFNQPFEFYKLYNKAARELGGFELSEEFILSLKNVTGEAEELKINN